MLRLLLATTLFISSSSADHHLRAGLDPKSVEIKKNDELCVPDYERGKFMSQYYEDTIVYQHFYSDPPQCGGTVIEMGGFDGMTYSNSWFFQYGLQWRTLLVEAYPENYKKMVKNRPDAINLQGAMCKGGGTVKFQTSNNGAAGGVAQDMSGKHKERWTDASSGVVEVQCMLLSDVLRDFYMTHVDLLFLDVEGGELTVLQTIAWQKIRIDIIVVEKDPQSKEKNEAIHKFLKALGYIRPLSMLDHCMKKQVGRVPMCMPSEIFVLKDFWDKRGKRDAAAAAAKRVK
jgi:FkbM family methyltransferase